MMLVKYRKKPVIIEAIQYTYPASDLLKTWLGNSCGTESLRPLWPTKGELEVLTLEDGFDDRVRHVATEGDYIIKGVQGEFYPCKPDIFELTYEKSGPEDSNGRERYDV